MIDGSILTFWELVRKACASAFGPYWLQEGSAEAIADHLKQGGSKPRVIASNTRGDFYVLQGLVLRVRTQIGWEVASLRPTAQQGRV